MPDAGDMIKPGSELPGVLVVLFDSSLKGLYSQNWGLTLVRAAELSRASFISMMAR